MTITHQPESPARRRARHLGVLSTAARLGVGTWLLVAAVRDGVEPIDAMVGLVAANAVVFGVLGNRGAAAPPLRFAGPAGHVINIALIFAFYALNATAANVFYGSAMLLAAARGYGACEMFAVWNWLRRRDDQFGCPFFLPVDIIDRQLTGRRREC